MFSISLELVKLKLTETVYLDESWGLAQISVPNILAVDE